MKTQNVTTQSFTGGLYVINKLSKKPALSIQKEKSNLLNLIKKENFDLYIKQDYRKNKINIIATTKTEPNICAVNEIPTVAKHSDYLNVSQKTIQDYKNIKEQLLYEEYQKNITLGTKIKDFIYDVLNVMIWGK